MPGNIIESSLQHSDTLTPSYSIEDLPHRRQGQRIDDPELKATLQAVFLEEFAHRANVTDSCLVAGISRDTAYRWLREDQEFASAWSDAEHQANDVLRREAFRRAVDGTEEPIVSMGKLVRNEDGSMITVKKYDTPLLMMLMRARMPEYRDSRQLTVDSNVNVNTSHQLTIDTRGMSQDDLASIRAIAERMKAQEQARIDKTGKQEPAGE